MANEYIKIPRITPDMLAKERQDTSEPDHDRKLYIDPHGNNVGGGVESQDGNSSITVSDYRHNYREC